MGEWLMYIHVRVCVLEEPVFVAPWKNEWVCVWSKL